MASFSHQKWTVMRLFVLAFLSFCWVEAAILSRETQQPCIANGKLKSFALNVNADFIPQANPDFKCGVASSPASRIVGGEVSQPNEYPWTAFLNLYFWSGDKATCTGTLIGSKWILTAAHCTYGVVNISVVLGSHDTSAGYEPHRQIFVVPAQNIKTYPGYYYGKTEDDMALLELPQEINYSKYILPACLPFSDDSDQVGDPVTLAGWGNYSSTPDSGLSLELRKVQTLVISSSGNDGQCQQLSGKGPFSGEKVICGDGSIGNRFCYGDDGGPMNYFNNLTETYTVVGVASVGDATVNCQSSRLPNIYGRVRYYLDWIYNNTDIAPTPKPTTTTTTTRTTVTTRTTTTTTTTEDPTVFSCTNKPNGLYANPFDDCSTIFYQCSNNNKYEKTCPDAGTVFNSQICACDFPYNVPACGVSPPPQKFF